MARELGSRKDAPKRKGNVTYKTSLIFLLLNGASYSPISLVHFVFGASFSRNSFVVIPLMVIVSFVALKIWNPNPLFLIARSQIWPRSRASMYDQALRLRDGGLARYAGKSRSYFDALVCSYQLNVLRAEEGIKSWGARCLKDKP